MRLTFIDGAFIVSPTKDIRKQKDQLFTFHRDSVEFQLISDEDLTSILSLLPEDFQMKYQSDSKANLDSIVEQLKEKN